MKEFFSIGEMAKLFSLNIRTLRYYDQIGLLKPAFADPQTGYRYYSTRQFERLNTIKYLRGLGVPIAKIQRVCDSRDIPALTQLLEEQQREIAARRRELERAERRLHNRLAQLREARQAPLGALEERWIGPRPIALLNRDIPLDSDLELPIRELERQNQLEAAMFLGKVGVSIRREELLSRRWEGFSSIFVFLEEGETATAGACLPGSDYLTLRFCGVHREARDQYLRMLAYLEERGLRLAGDSVEIALIDGGITGDTGEFVTELQLPFARG